MGSRNTLGEIIFAVVSSAFAPILAAVAGFVGAIFLCSKLLKGEATEAGLILAPAAAIVLAMVAFAMCFRKIITYGENQQLCSRCRRETQILGSAQDDSFWSGGKQG